MQNQEDRENTSVLSQVLEDVRGAKKVSSHFQQGGVLHDLTNASSLKVSFRQLLPSGLKEEADVEQHRDVHAEEPYVELTEDEKGWLKIELRKVRISVAGIEGTCLQPFREYKVRCIVESSRGLQREVCKTFRYSFARAVLLHQMQAKLKKLGLMDSFADVLALFPPKSAGFVTTKQKLSISRAQGMEAFVRLLLTRIFALRANSTQQNAARELQAVFVENFLEIDAKAIAASIKVLESVVLGFHK